jgi:hypothetical protein
MKDVAEEKTEVLTELLNDTEARLFANRLCALRYAGKTNPEIAKEMGFSEGTLYNRLRNSIVQDEIRKFGEAVLSEGRERFKGLLKLAVDVLEKALKDEDKSIALKAAQLVLERVIPVKAEIDVKAVPMIQIVSSTPIEIVKQIDGESRVE